MWTTFLQGFDSLAQRHVYRHQPTSCSEQMYTVRVIMYEIIKQQASLKSWPPWLQCMVLPRLCVYVKWAAAMLVKPSLCPRPSIPKLLKSSIYALYSLNFVLIRSHPGTQTRSNLLSVFVVICRCG